MKLKIMHFDDKCMWKQPITKYFNYVERKKNQWYNNFFALGNMMKHIDSF